MFLNRPARTRLTSPGPLAFCSTAFAFFVCHVLRARGENQVGYRYETYKEDGGRIGVTTDSMLF